MSGKIHKLSGYIVDPHNCIEPATFEMAVDEAVKPVCCRAWFQHFHFESAELENGYEEELGKNTGVDCDLAFCEKYFASNGRQYTSIKVFHQERPEIKAGDIWRHFKTGKLIEIIAVAQDTESVGNFHVVYRCPDGSVWARPFYMFMSKTDKVKYPNATQEWRFELVRRADKTEG